MSSSGTILLHMAIPGGRGTRGNCIRGVRRRGFDDRPLRVANHDREGRMYRLRPAAMKIPWGDSQAETVSRPLWLSRVAPSAELKSVRLAGLTWHGRASGQEWPRPKAPHPGSGEAPFPLFSPSFFLSSYSFSCFGFFLMRLYRALEVVGVLARSCSGADLRQPEIPRRARGPI